MSNPKFMIQKETLRQVPQFIFDVFLNYSFQENINENTQGTISISIVVVRRFDWNTIIF